MSKPVVGWSVAGVAILLALVMLWRSLTGSNPYDTSRLAETVTVRFTDTDDEVKLLRADFERQLRSSPGKLTTSSGIVNPKTGKPTGILVATREWDEVVNRINEERDWAKQNSPFGGPPAKPAGPK